MKRAKIKESGDTRQITKKNRIPKNPRVITPEEMERLGQSLKEFGDLSGVILNRRTGHLVGGNQRTTSFSQEELTATITQKLKKPDRTGTVAFGYIAMHGTQYSYREVDWPEEKEAAANIAANQHGGEFNQEELKEILASLKPEALALTGFGKDELEEILESASGSSFAVTTPPASDAFAGGAQFKRNRSATIEIKCTERMSQKSDLKKAIQSLCDKFGLSYKIKLQ